ncbi:MAG: putative selenium-dependent hydroxylase accessory protein YqeC [Clostridiales bacterium]|nr:putative selenium-dependent hydroxylase accessory protein YqeC [Clostridiales bacterium]
MQTIFFTNGDSIIRALDPPRGVTALVGGGGKTTLMLRLARALSSGGARVIVTTTTHIFPPGDIRTLTHATEDEIDAALTDDRLVCLGTPAEQGKLSAPELRFARMAKLADYVLVEADGAKRLPLKAPAKHEPVIPPETKLVIALAGLDGAGQPISQAAFRPERYAALCGKQEGDRVTARDIARVLGHSEGQRKGVLDGMRYVVVLNKADDDERKKIALEIASELKNDPVERAVIAALGEER